MNRRCGDEKSYSCIDGAAMVLAWRYELWVRDPVMGAVMVAEGKSNILSHRLFLPSSTLFDILLTSLFQLPKLYFPSLIALFLLPMCIFLFHLERLKRITFPSFGLAYFLDFFLLL